MSEEIKDKVEEIGNEIREGINEAADTAAAAFASAKEKAQSKVDEIKKEIDDYSDEMDPDDVNNNKFMAVLCYIGVLVIIPIVAARNSKYVRFHANQGLVLFLLELACSVLIKLKLLGWVFSICSVVLFVMAIIGIIYAAQGKAKELPVIGNWKILK